MNNVIQYFVKRLHEPSTWRGIVAILTGAGVSINPAHVEAIIAGGLGVIGIIGAFTPDQKNNG